MTDPGLGGKVDDSVEAALTIADREQGLAVGNIQLMEREAVSTGKPIEPRAFKGWIVIVIQIIDPDDLLVAAEKGLADVIPDEPGRAGHEDGHATIFRGNGGSGIAVWPGILKQQTRQPFRNAPVRTEAKARILVGPGLIVRGRRGLVVSFQQAVHSVRTEEAEGGDTSDFQGDQMDMHQNVRLTPHCRAWIVRCVESGQTPKAIALAASVCSRTVRKWVARYRCEGLEGLKDRSSRPRRLYRPTPRPVVERIVELRRQRWTCKRIAAAIGVSPATVSRILRRLGVNRLKALEPAAAVLRYERDQPGELIHIDIKKLGRFTQVGHRITGDRTSHRTGRNKGWEFVHVCVDDHSRIAFTQIKPDEKAISAVAFLQAAVAYYKSLGVRVQRVMTDNGSCYKSFAWRDACKALVLKHIRTKPYTPQTNGKAQRFVQTVLREWAYAHAFQTSNHRAADLPRWTHQYNWHRPHGGIKSQTPISRLGLSEDNLLRLHT